MKHVGSDTSLAAESVQSADTFNTDNSLDWRSPSSRRQSAPRDYTGERSAGGAFGTGPVYTLMRLPLLLGIACVLLLEVIAYVLVRLVVRGWEACTRRHRSSYGEVWRATSYNRWRKAVKALDSLESRSAGSARDVPQICALTRRLRELRSVRETRMRSRADERPSSDDAEAEEEETTLLLRTVRTVCASHDVLKAEHLFHQNHQGKNGEVDAYTEEVLHAVRVLSRRLKSGEERNTIFRELRESFGAAALCLSGGAANAYYHLGVAKALHERNLLPDHITGASGGSLVGSFLCVRTDEELTRDLRPEVTCALFNPCEGQTWGVCLRRLAATGNIFDPQLWQERLVDHICFNLTFREAYERTGRTLTIVVYSGVVDADSGSATRCLNYKTAPNVLIASAVLCSSALPRLLPASELLRKTKDGAIVPDHSFGQCWRDGSMEDELPFERLNHHFGVTFPIVSQVEPHLVPFFYENRGSAGNAVAHRGGRGWRGGFLLSYVERLIKLDLKKWLELIRDFDLMPRVPGERSSVANVFLGRSFGAVTMVAPLDVTDYIYLASDPHTVRRMTHYMLGGERATWMKLGMLKHHVRIARAMEDALILGPESADPKRGSKRRDPPALGRSLSSVSAGDRCGVTYQTS